MAFSRTSSPATSSVPNSPSELTPRSKVRAMLAALDDDSDDGSDKIPKNLNFISNARPRVVTGSEHGQDTVNPPYNVNTVDDDAEIEDGDGETIGVKPRGMLAARMLSMRPEFEANEGEQGEPETARDRVKKLLATQAIRSDDEGENSEGDRGEEHTVKARKMKIQRVREATPNMETDRIGHGGMFVPLAADNSSTSAREALSSEDDLPANPVANARFMALVEKKRQERLAKEAEIRSQKAEKAAERARSMKNHSQILEDGGLGYSDDDGGRKLTQQARPTRKASKRALEDMHRETQRMSRNMQLAHEARTKKKITKSDLFARFNYKPAGFLKELPEQTRPTSSSSAPQTDTEMKDTPPTSPFSHTYDSGKVQEILEDGGNLRDVDIAMAGINSEEDIPTLKDALSCAMRSSPPTLTINKDKGKGRAFEVPEPLPSNTTTLQHPEVTLDFAPVQVRPPQVALKSALAGNDSDSDLEIVPNQKPTKKAKDSIFDRIPAKQARESHSLQALRLLAHVTSPGKQSTGRNMKSSLTATELQTSLQQRARQQAAREREERLQALRDRGVILQTAEEREKEMADIEDLMAKARREGEDIMKRERDAAKREKRARGEVDPEGEGSDDEEWEEEKGQFAEQESVSDSDSGGDDDGDASNEEEEEEEEDNDDDEDDEAVSVDEKVAELAKSKQTATMIDNEASESDTAEEDGDMHEGGFATDSISDDGDILINAHHDEEELPRIQVRRRTKHIVVSDDEDEQKVDLVYSKVSYAESPVSRKGESPKVPTSVLRSATKTFIPGLTVAGPAGLGLTQIFAGTMDDSQAHASQDVQSQPFHEFDTAQDSLAFLRNLPGPDLPEFEPTMDEDSQDIIKDSQTQFSQVPESPISKAVSQDIHLQFSQSQIHAFDSIPQHPPTTQLSEYPEPTQDAGFQAISPVKGRFVEPPPSTIDTIVLQQTPLLAQADESPIAKKRGKLRRRNETANVSGEYQGNIGSEAVTDEIGNFETSENIFDVMRKASKQKDAEIEDFNKKKSGAKEMVQEQAEESEDEYAGLGGVSDDESGGEEDAYVKEIIDDEGGKDVDERQLAAFHADKERASDEKKVEKLFKDITNGMLRRKRGADYDLSDSDDGGEARRRMRRNQEARLRKALLEDERIGKIAENPKKMAFLRAIEDRGEDDEIDFLEEVRIPNFRSLRKLGMLRRKRGADYDLSDSDDGGEARRRMRRNQEARLRKALLEDERIGKIAENPKKMAFLRAIEDRGEDEMDFLEDLEDAEETAESQSQSLVDLSQKEVLQINDSQPNTAMGPPKRKFSQDTEPERRLPPHLRRTKPAKRPANLSEIRESLSSLIEEPNMIIMPHESSGSESEEENEGSSTESRLRHKDKENRDPFASRHKESIAVVDRISLKRATSNTLSTTTRLAFAAPSSTPGFKVPALLRRTTTNSSISSGSSTSGVSGTERMAGGFADEARFSKKATKNSGVNYFARENERKVKVEENEKRRKEKRWKGAEGRRKVVGGLFGMGKFE